MVNPNGPKNISPWILEYYSKPKVAEELFNYGKDRWIAIEGNSKGRRIFIRYFRNGSPLRFEGSNNVIGLLRRFQFVEPRSFYGSVNKYGRISVAEDLGDTSNILRSTPTWDVDNEVRRWRETLSVCKLIVDELDRERIVKSVYLKWSGRGCHVHISEEAFSKEFLEKQHPLDAAFAVVEYIARMIKPKLISFPNTRVENKMDLKRVFTLPLSLHRELDYSCICFGPDDIEDFDLSWVDPKNFRHKSLYNSFEAGEADELAEKALSTVGGYFKKVVLMSPSSVRDEKGGAPRLGRFQVMALLQAARCFLLTGDFEKSKSFGLNRAIFYAWAKRRGMEAKKPRSRSEVTKHAEKQLEEKNVFRLGNEVAYLSDDGWLTIGDTKQTPQDYDVQIARRINSVIPYEEAWRRALEYLRKFPQETLLDQQRFFNQVYKPVRDSFIEKIYRKETGFEK